MFSSGLVEWTKANLGENAENKRRHHLLSQLTIVIPSFCRQDYLLRQIIYWSFCRATIIIVDGSPTPLNSQLVDLISAVPNIEYLNIIDSYTNRLKEACRLIKTPYAMCLADDDIFLMEGLCRTIDHLNRNSDIVACMGQVLGVDYDDKKKCAYFFPYGDSLKNYEVKYEDPIKRIQFGINDYRTATSYAVLREQTFKDVWNSLQMTSCLEATEYEHAIATYTLGSLSTIPHIYWIRSVECEPVDSLIDGTRKTDFFSWWTWNEYAKERVDWVSRLAVMLSKHSSLNEQDAGSEIIKVIDYILDGRHKGLMNENQSIVLLTGILKVIKKFLFLHKYFIKFKSSHFGGVIRNTVMASIRGAETELVSATKYGMTDQSVLELKNVLVFISDFHEAKRPAAK